MKRCPIGLLVTLTRLLAPLAASAQPASQVHRIGNLTDGTGTGQESFVQGLRDQG
jgi:hypothetical protein